MKKRIHYQHGFSLLSLMIASLIGLIITAAALKMYANSQQTYKARQVYSAASENARFAIADLRSMIVMAGRGMRGSAANNQNIKVTFTTLPASTLTHSDGGSTGSDVIHFRLAQGRDCMGNQILTTTNVTTGVVTGTVTRIRYFVATNGDGINELRCQINDGAAQALVSGIEMLKFLYGRDTTNDGYANSYLNSDELDALVAANANIWEEIISVRVGVIASSAEFTLPGTHQDANTPKDMFVLHGKYTPADKSRVYRSNTATVALRNLIIQ